MPTGPGPARPPRTLALPLLLGTALLLGAAPDASPQELRFEVTISPELHQEPVTGRLVVVLSDRAEPEPRLLIGPSGPAIFGIDLEAHPPGEPVLLDDSAVGYPFPLSEVPPGAYHVQALVHRYEQVHRADGHVLWLPMNDGRREPFNVKGGNFTSSTQAVTVGVDGTVRILVDEELPERPLPPDTEWIKRVSIQSPMLSEFWGRPIHVQATVLLPRGYEENPDVRYPAVYAMVHNVPFGFTTDSAGVRGLGEIDPVRGVETGYDFYRSWIEDDFPRVVAISFQMQTPYFPDSYAVNSVNNGPYGDAVVKEIIPELERRFRILDEPWARIVEGASTGGWQALALQLQHPEYFGGAWVLQPDPIDFRHYLLVDIYEDENAFEIPAGMFTSADRYFRRSVRGQPLWTMRQMSLFEAVLGTRGRSGFQLAGWESVYGPMDDDGYPRPLWDPFTGTIDRTVAEYMRDNGYDLRDYAERNWGRIGPLLQDKLHFFVPDMDDFYLNVAMYRFEDFLAATENPHHPPNFTYGRPMKGHSWHDHTWAEMIRRMEEHMLRLAPEGADTSSWRY